MSIVVGAAQLDGRGKAFHAEFLHAGQRDVERLEAPPHVLTVDEFLAGDLLSGADRLRDQNRIPDGAIVEVLANLVFRCNLALAFVDDVLEDVLNDWEVRADRIEAERAIALRFRAGQSGVIIVARPPNADHPIHRESDLGRFLDGGRVHGAPALQIDPVQSIAPDVEPERALILHLRCRHWIELKLETVVRLPFVKRVIKSLGGRALIIGVDRLDYSKGIAERLSAFERFLQRQAEWRGKVTYLQIAPKSRTEIPEYAAIEQEIGAAAGRINGAYGEADWTPIRYVNRAYAHATLAGLYRAARVALVTPLRDGMNLVAKEYIASQNPDDPGVLILSRFAGAAQECKAALLVNPYDPDSVAAALGQALSMSLAERRERHASMFRTLSRNDIRHWAHNFLSALEREPSTSGLFKTQSVR
jgi:glycosyltransferase involved in cell wall biosynthesis